MKTKTILWIVGIIGAVLFLPKILAKMRPNASELPAQPPTAGDGLTSTPKKTIFGKIVNGATQIGGSVGGQYGSAVASIGGALSQFTK